MRNDLWSDNWCVLTEMPNGQVLYADMMRNVQTMPLAWAKKIVALFESGNYNEGLNHVNMVDRLWVKRKEVK